jgi:ubiquinone biosynthesis protein COQ4
MRNPLVLVKLARAALTLVKDPDALGMVFDLADNLADDSSVDLIIDHVRQDAGGARALVEKPRVDVDLATLRAMPEGSFGRETARFLDARGLDPTNLPKRKAADTRSWVRAHLYETHDLWHVATGFDTDVAGEVGLQAFYLAQFPGKLAALLLGIMFFNTAIYRFDDRTRRMDAIAAGWQLGKSARPLFGLRWADLWSSPVGEVRARLGLEASRALAA